MASRNAAGDEPDRDASAHTGNEGPAGSDIGGGHTNGSNAPNSDTHNSATPGSAPDRDSRAATNEPEGKPGESGLSGVIAEIADALKAAAGLIAEAFGFGSGHSAHGPDALAALALKAFQAHPNACNHPVAHVAEAMGNKDLSGVLANGQVAVMEKAWEKISAMAAQTIANGGGLAVAGLANERGHGHTAVVVPGSGAMRGGEFYPNVAGGGSAAGRSDGSKTAADV